MAENILEMNHIIKEFSGVRALDDVSFQVKAGSIHALVGENGAGKSTLINVLSGIHPYGSYSGEILFNGELCRFSRIFDSEAKGIVVIHQELALVPYMTIGENMFLGNERGCKYAIDWDQTYAEAAKYLKMAGLSDSPYTLIKDIGVGKQQLVEIAKALAKKARLLVLDEPTSSLNETDSQALLELLLAFKKEGLASILISHKLNEISYVADDVTILRDGKTIETLHRGLDDFSEAHIIQGMVGREITDRFPKREKQQLGEAALEVKDWNLYHPVYTDKKVVDNVSFHVRKGEIVGFSGLIGAGRTELAMSIFGNSYGTGCSGTLKIQGKTVKLRSAREAIDHGLAYLSEDRKGKGLILSYPIRINTTLASLQKISSRGGVINTEMETAVTESYRRKLRTKCTVVEQPVEKLSGGNQQKVMLAKWLYTDPDILILDEPTRGIDIGAKYDIYCLMNQLVSEGKSLILISSEMPEILGMCDRIYVMNEGRLVGEFSQAEATQEKIMTCIIESAAKDERNRKT